MVPMWLYVALGAAVVLAAVVGAVFYWIAGKSQDE
jgi:hypothetical protein